MKAISLLQPWATLAVIGAKVIETRSWDTKYRGDILIHASKKMDPEQKAICKTEPFKTALKDVDQLSLGMIIGKVNIIGTTNTETYKLMGEGIPLKKRFSKKEWETEFAFGDYTPGRYGWLLSDPVLFKTHIPAKGSLGLWFFDEWICMRCGCTETNCRHCIEKTGKPCHWVEINLCSACIK